MAVRPVLAEAGLTELLDEALLLTTELVTNAVLHARTEMDVEITADTDSLTITVTDSHTGPFSHNRPGPVRAIDQLDERGRGLQLVDRIATYWGTLYYPDRKGVWFRLERLSAGTEHRPVTVPAEATPITAKTLDGLVILDRLTDGPGLPELGEQLLSGLGAAVGAAGGAIIADAGDGQGRRTVAGYGSPVPAIGGVRAPLPLVRPWRGELVLTKPAAGYVRALVDLTAERVALTLENERLRRTDTERRTWLTYLAEVSELLAQSLDADLTLALIPRLVVPRLGRWCAVHVSDALGGLRLSAVTHVDESVTANLQELLADALPRLREAQQIDAVVPLPAPTDGYAVSMSARSQQLGVLSVGQGDHPLDSEELAVVEDVARRAALAIDNARIHAERRAVAEALQRSLLPPALPKVDGIEFGAEHVPTGEGVDVGGDVYDAVALPAGAWRRVLRDVAARGA